LNFVYIVKYEDRVDVIDLRNEKFILEKNVDPKLIKKRYMCRESKY